MCEKVSCQTRGGEINFGQRSPSGISRKDYFPFLDSIVGGRQNKHIINNFSKVFHNYFLGAEMNFLAKSKTSLDALMAFASCPISQWLVAL